MYASQILQEFDIEACTPALVLMSGKVHLGAKENSPKVDVQRFQRLVGMLIYLANMKPKIAFATGMLSRFMHDS